MKHTFLLFIDILGFGNLCRNLDERMERIYEIIFKMRTNGAQVYEITTFSDTVLVTNRGGHLDSRSEVQFLVEFSQLLEQRLSNIDIYTRAVMSLDQFHSELRDDVYIAYGPAAVAANDAEKSKDEKRRIKGLSLYLLPSCAKHNFTTTAFK